MIDPRHRQHIRLLAGDPLDLLHFLSRLGVARQRSLRDAFEIDLRKFRRSKALTIFTTRRSKARLEWFQGCLGLSEGCVERTGSDEEARESFGPIGPELTDLRQNFGAF